MTTTGSRRGGQGAESPETARGRLTRKLFAVYDRHPPFRAALGRLAREHRAAIAACAPRETVSPSGGAVLEVSWADGRPIPGHPVRAAVSLGQARARAATDPVLADYIAALDALVAWWGLDRLGVVPLPMPHAPEPSDERPGPEAVHAWCVLCHDRVGAAVAFGAGHLISSLATGVDTAVRLGDFSARWDPEDESRTDRDVPVPEHLLAEVGRHPAVRLRLVGGRLGSFVPTDGARTRIRRAAEVAKSRRLTSREADQLDEQLGRIEAGFETAGRVHPDTAPAEDRHLRWTFLRLVPAGRDGRPRSPWQIAPADRAGEKTVRNETDKMRMRLGIDRFPPGARRPERAPRSKPRR